MMAHCGLVMEWKRARNSKQVELRVQSITDACEKLLSKSLPQDLKMRDIAEESGLAVGAIYRYFSSKEALILSVYLNKMQDLLNDVANYSPIEGGLEELSIYLAKTYAEHKFFWYLSTFAGTILETNLPENEVKEHKISAMEMTSNCIEQLVTKVPEMSIEEIFTLFMDSFFYTCGIYSFAFPPKHIDKILEDPKLSNFKPAWESSIHRMLNGLLFIRD